MQSKVLSIKNGNCEATVTITTETGKAFLNRQMAEVILGIHETDQAGNAKLSSEDRYYREQFAAAYAWSTVSGDLGFEWPQSPFDAGMLEACEAWLSMPGTTVRDWLLAMNEVARTPNDPDLKPPELVSQKKEATPE